MSRESALTTASGRLFRLFSALDIFWFCAI